MSLVLYSIQGTIQFYVLYSVYLPAHQPLDYTFPVCGHRFSPGTEWECSKQYLPKWIKIAVKSLKWFYNPPPIWMPVMNWFHKSRERCSHPSYHGEEGRTVRLMTWDKAWSRFSFSLPKEPCANWETILVFFCSLFLNAHILYPPFHRQRHLNTAP